MKSRMASILSGFIVIVFLVISVIFQSNAATHSENWQRGFVQQLLTNESALLDQIEQLQIEPSDARSLDMPAGILRIQWDGEFNGIYFCYSDTFSEDVGFLVTMEPVSSVPMFSGVTIEVVDSGKSIYVYRLIYSWN